MRLLLILTLLSSAIPLAAEQERVLIPITPRDTPGAFGTMWRTELTISNFGDARAELAATGALPVAIGIPPKSSVFLDFLPNARMWRVMGNDLAFHLRVRNLGSPECAPTEIRVVREKEFFDTTLHITGVPLTTDNRLLLRIYAVLDTPRSVMPISVEMRNAETGELVHEETLIAFTLDVPAVDMIELPLPSGPPAGKEATIKVTSAEQSKLWAFVSATNNATQCVHAITP